MIEAENLSKDYGTVVAVKDLSFRVGAGEIVGFLGPNGAGKSTTLRILAGFLGATSGSVRIDGHDVTREPLAAKQKLGYMPEAAPLYPEMRVSEYLGFRAAVKRVPRARRKPAVERAMDLASVKDMRDTLIAHLSKGYRQRVALADALVASPPLLILDEPTAGLDPNQIRETRRVIRDLAKTHTILLSTHILPEVEATCDRALVIDRGRLVAEGSLSELAALGKAKTLLVELNDSEGVAAGRIQCVEGVERIESTRTDAGHVRLTLHVSLPPGDVAERVARLCAEANLGLRALTPGKASLEDVFAALTERAEGGSA
ncbi:MAG: ABC transporter ATP-binding protein [Myxococcota bacterium]